MDVSEYFFIAQIYFYAADGLVLAVESMRKKYKLSHKI